MDIFKYFRKKGNAQLTTAQQPAPTNAGAQPQPAPAGAPIGSPQGMQPGTAYIYSSVGNQYIEVNPYQYPVNTPFLRQSNGILETRTLDQNGAEWRTGTLAYAPNARVTPMPQPAPTGTGAQANGQGAQGGTVATGTQAPAQGTATPQYTAANSPEIRALEAQKAATVRAYSTKVVKTEWDRIQFEAQIADYNMGINNVKYLDTLKAKQLDRRTAEDLTAGVRRLDQSGQADLAMGEINLSARPFLNDLNSTNANLEGLIRVADAQIMTNQQALHTAEDLLNQYVARNQPVNWSQQFNIAPVPGTPPTGTGAQGGTATDVDNSAAMNQALADGGIDSFTPATARPAQGQGNTGQGAQIPAPVAGTPGPTNAGAPAQGQAPQGTQAQGPGLGTALGGGWVVG